MLPQLKFLGMIQSLSRNVTGRVPPFFCEYHVLKTLLILQQQTISRERLAEKLCIGESSTRTLINRLKKYRLISTSRRDGCSLTDFGRQVVDEFKKIVPKIILNTNLKKLCLDYFNAGLLMKNFPVYDKTRIILQIRDLVIRNGGNAALILQATVNGIIIPPIGVDDDAYEDLKRIKEILKPDKDDLIILSFAQTQYEAEKSLLMALITFLNNHVKGNYNSINL